jgi:hypothetical protein
MILLFVMDKQSLSCQTGNQFLGAFAKITKKTAYYLRHVCLSVRKEQLGTHWKDFREI